MGPNGRLWLAEFEVLHGGVPIRGARVFFRVNSGNIVQFGTELVGDVQISARPAVDRGRALRLALTGTDRGPELAAVLAALSRDEALGRTA